MNSLREVHQINTLLKAPTGLSAHMLILETAERNMIKFITWIL
jgi:EAL domain-containing protein (putative c-di-GMP-specific phosphodiesterase class I)